MKLKLAVPDLVSNSYFPAVAAVTLGAFKEQGLDVTIELVSPLIDCVNALRDGSADIMGASAHAPLFAFPAWRGVKLLCAQAQGTYWLLVMRKDLAIRRGDMAALKGRRIAAVPFVGAALSRILVASGLDPVREGIEIMMPGDAGKPGINFGVAAAAALQAGTIDGFFANGMGAEVAIHDGIGTLVLDVRRGDGPSEAFHYTLPAITARAELLSERPDVAAKIVTAIVKMQAALKRDISLAATVGQKLFPPHEAPLIASVVARDLPYYDAVISPSFVVAMKRYARDVGLLDGDPSYEDIVAVELQEFWKAS
jgi:NitT/TauT family transport system substrate-binding protein